MLAVLIIGKAAAIGDRVAGERAAKDDERPSAEDSAAACSGVAGESAAGERQYFDEVAIEADPAAVDGAVAGKSARGDLHRAGDGSSAAVAGLGGVGREGAARDIQRSTSVE